LKTSENTLRQIELNYEAEEKKLTEMTKEYNHQTRNKADADAAEGETDQKRKKNYEEIIQLECQCKLTQHTLVNLANKIKEEYSHLKECYRNLMLYKDDVSQRLHEIGA